jgi:hypothetical protein
MPEHSLDQLPDDQREEPDADDPQQDLAERLLGELAQRALPARRPLVVAECELDSQIGDQQMHQPVGHQPDPDCVVEHVAVFGLPAGAVGLRRHLVRVHCARPSLLP